jgi:hypothetical protein
VIPATRAARVWTVALLAAAAANLGAGTWLLARDPARGADLYELSQWTQAWIAGSNPYANAATGIDYPPWALVLLAPVASAGATVARVAWACLNLCALGAIVWRLGVYTGETREFRVRLGLVCLSCAAAHTLGQFSAVSFACAIAGVLGPGGAPGALWLGLSLFKPHIGGIALLWALFERRWRLAVGALVVPAVLLAVFCLRAGATPVGVMAGYVQSLVVLHGGDLPFTGHTDLAPWLVFFAPHATGLVVDLALACLLLLPLVVASARGRAVTDRDALARLAFCGAVSLLAVRHLSYDFIVLFPLVAAWRTWPYASAHRPRVERLKAGVLVACLVLEVPSIARRFAVTPASAGWTRLLLEGDRVFVLAVWLVLAVGLLGSRPARKGYA